MTSRSDCTYSVLLIEDDIIAADAIKDSLESLEFEVHHAKTGKECFALLEKIEPAIALVDLNLPDQPGHEVCKKLRRSRLGLIPIIALSGTNSDSEIVMMLESGADDFVSKTSSFPILVAHIRSALKRVAREALASTNPEVLRWGPIQIDRSSWKVSINDEEVPMTPTELRLLTVFLASPDSVFTRDQLIDHLHGTGYAVTPRTIDVHINGLRNNLGAFRAQLETVRGIGYRFVPSAG